MARPVFVAVASVGALLVTSVVTRPARAEPSIEVAWTAPEGCPDGVAMRASIDRLVTSAPAQAVRVTGVVRREDAAEGAWVVDLDLQGGASGVRTLRASTCRGVSRAAALVVALAVDPHANVMLEEPPAPAPEPPVAVPVPPVPVSPAPSPALVAPAPARVHAVVFAGGSVSHAVVPGLVPGVFLGGGVTWRWLRVDVSAQLQPSASGSLARLPAAGADFLVVDVAVRGCVGRDVAWLSLAACATGRGARIRAEGTGVAETYRQTADVVTLEPGLLLRVPATSRFAVEVDGAAVVPLTRPRFVFLSGGANEEVFRVAVVGVRAGIGGSVRF